MDARGIDIEEFNRGAAALLAGNYLESRRCFEEMARLHPRLLAAKLNLLKSYQGLGEGAAYRALLAELLEAHPEFLARVEEAIAEESGGGCQAVVLFGGREEEPFGEHYFGEGGGCAFGFPEEALADDVTDAEIQALPLGEALLAHGPLRVAEALVRMTEDLSESHDRLCPEESCGGKGFLDDLAARLGEALSGVRAGHGIEKTAPEGGGGQDWPEYVYERGAGR